MGGFTLTEVDFGAEGDAAPALPTNARGVLGRLRAIFDVLAAGLDTNVVTMPPVSGQVGHDVSGIGSGTKTVTMAGTRVALAPSTAAKYVTVQSHDANPLGSLLVVGGAAVVAATGSRQGIALPPGGAYSFPCDNLNDVNLDGTVDGLVATYPYHT